MPSFQLPAFVSDILYGSTVAYAPLREVNLAGIVVLNHFDGPGLPVERRHLAAIAEHTRDGVLQMSLPCRHKPAPVLGPIGVLQAGLVFSAGCICGAVIVAAPGLVVGAVTVCLLCFAYGVVSA